MTTKCDVGLLGNAFYARKTVAHVEIIDTHTCYTVILTVIRLFVVFLFMNYE